MGDYGTRGGSFGTRLRGNYGESKRFGFGAKQGVIIPDILDSDFYTGSDIIAAYLPRKVYVNSGAGGSNAQTISSVNDSQQLILRQNTAGSRPIFNESAETLEVADDHFIVSSELNDLASIMLSGRNDVYLVAIVEGVVSTTQFMCGFSMAGGDFQICQWDLGKQKFVEERGVPGELVTAAVADTATVRMHAWFGARNAKVTVRVSDTIDEGDASADNAFEVGSVTGVSKVFGTFSGPEASTLNKIHGFAWRTSIANYSAWKNDWEKHLGLSL
jgi:hypothetical protein